MKIKSENVLIVIENFKKMLPYAKENHMLNMRLSSVTECGSPHCHGGWYALACEEEKKDSKLRYSYGSGGRLMAKHLGFEENFSERNWRDPLCDICDYMGAHPEIWGNNRGEYMFAHADAFTSPTRPEGAKNLQHIVDHWTDVYSRIKAMEDIKYEDITKELAVLPVDEKSDFTIKELINQ